jgi:putative redox protein
MTSRVEYLGELRTTAEHLQSSTIILTDAPTDNHGKGEAFSPTDLCATSLANCMMTIMGISARSRDIELKGMTAEVTKIMAANPRRIARIEVNLYMPAGSYSDTEKKVLQAAAHTCPVAMSLHPDIEQMITFNWP